MKHHNTISYEYHQDYINGITGKEYEALFHFLEKFYKTTVMDLCGGTGELSLKLQAKGFDVLLCDIDEELLQIATEKGVKNVKKINLLEDVLPHSEMIIMKSSQHEFRREYLKKIHLKIYNALPPAGIYIDWDSHVQTREQAEFLLYFANLKDTLSSDRHLVMNRAAYTASEIKTSLSDTGFRNVVPLHTFFYTLSVAKFSEAYFKDTSGIVNREKRSVLYHKTLKLIDRNGVPQGIHCEMNKDNIIFQIPAVILKAEKH